MKPLLPALLAIATVIGAPVRAETLTRCTGPRGQLTWSNVGCAPADRAEKVEVNPAVVDSRELREWARRSPPVRTPAVARQRSAGEPRAVKVRDPVACENAQRDYRFEAASRNFRRGGMGVLRDEVKRACGGV